MRRKSPTSKSGLIQVCRFLLQRQNYTIPKFLDYKIVGKFYGFIWFLIWELKNIIPRTEIKKRQVIPKSIVYIKKIENFGGDQYKITLIKTL